MSKTHVKKLDDLSHRFLKKWVGIPKSATNVIFHSSVGLDITPLETLYNICHTQSHISMRIKGDRTVNDALNSAIERESKWTHKQSTVVQCESIYLKALDKISEANLVTVTPVESEIIVLSNSDKTKLTCKAKSVSKDIIFSDQLEEQNKHVSKLIKQGEYFKITQQKKM